MKEGRQGFTNCCLPRTTLYRVDGITCVVTAQFGAMVDELARRREECIQLRTLIATRSKGQTDIASESYGGHCDLVNEDGELEMAYKTQRDLNKYVSLLSRYVRKLVIDNCQHYQAHTQSTLFCDPSVRTKRIFDQILKLLPKIAMHHK